MENELNIEKREIDILKEYLDEKFAEQTEEIKKLIGNEQKENSEIENKKNLLKEKIDELTNMGQQYKLLKEEYIQLKEEKDNTEKKYEDAHKTNLAATRIIEKLEKQIEDIISNEEKIKLENDDLQRKIQVYENRYLDINNMFNLYMELENDNKQRLKNIFGLDNLILFVSALHDWNTVDGLWNYAKRRIIEKDNKNIIQLSILFKQIFNVYNINFNNENYSLISPEIGTRYDSDKHSILGIKTDGIVSEVLLEGVQDKTTGKIIFKAMVNVQ